MDERGDEGDVDYDGDDNDGGIDDGDAVGGIDDDDGGGFSVEDGDGGGGVGGCGDEKEKADNNEKCNAGACICLWSQYVLWH